MIIAAIDFASVLPVALFITFAAGAWFVLDLMSSGKPRAEERLAEMNSTKGGLAKGGSTSNKFAEALEKAAPAFSKPLQPKTAAEEDKLVQKLSYAGFRRPAAPQVFLLTKLASLCIGLFFGGAGVLFVNGFSIASIGKAVAIGGIMLYLPNVVLWFMARKRMEAIFLSLPDVLDLMVVCVEAGLGLDQAMRKVSEEMRSTYRVICDELQLSNLQLQMGRTRNEVLQELGDRTGVDDLKSLSSILIQADKFGSSVGKALRVQSDSMRTKRSQIAEEKAAKTAVQLIFPLVLFIFPGIFVVLVGPAAITMLTELFPMMNPGG
jgi:tight adherence protein C